MTEDTGDASAPAGQVPGENEDCADVTHTQTPGSAEQRRPGFVHIPSDVDQGWPGKATRGAELGSHTQPR